MRARSFWFAQAIATGLLLFTAINGIRPMASYRALELGASPFELGVVGAAYASLSLVIAIPIGRRVDRLGEARFIIAGAVLLFLVALALVGISSIPGLIVSQALLGVGQGLAVVGIQSLVARGGDPTQRDGRFGIFTAIVSLGQLLGPGVAGLVAGSAGGTATPALVLAAGVSGVGVLAAASMWLWPPPVRPAAAGPGEPGGQEPATRSVRDLVRLPGMTTAVLTSMSVLACVDILIVYMPSFGELHGIGVATIGLLLATRAATATLSRVIMGPLVRMLGRRTLLVSTLSVTALALAMIPLAGPRVPVLYVLMALAGFGLGLGQPITMSWVAGAAPEGQRATALAMRITGNRLAQFTVPLGVGAIAGATGVSAIFIALGVLLTASTTLVARSSFGSRDEQAGPARP